MLVFIRLQQPFAAAVSLALKLISVYLKEKQITSLNVIDDASSPNDIKYALSAEPLLASALHLLVNVSRSV